MLNNFVGVARLVKDPELRKANNDTSICVLTLAIDNTLKEVDGTRGTLFLDAKTFGDKADNIAKYCRKGSKVAVGGSLNQRNFVRQDGSKGKVIELVIDDVEFLDPKPQEPKVDEKVDSEPSEPEQPKFDPFTGEPLTPKAKK